MKNEIKYFRLDHSNNFTFTTQEEEQSTTLSFFMLIASVSDESIGTEINKYFNQLLPPNKSNDLYQINLFLRSKNEFDLQSINNHMNTLLNIREHNSIFIFNQTNVYALSTMLFYIFDQISNKKNKYKIKTHNDFIKAINSVNRTLIDDIRLRYLERNANREIIYKAPNERGRRYVLPIELILLLSQFENFKHIVLTIEQCDLAKTMLDGYLIILLNVEWLFPHLMEVSIRFHNESFQSVLNEHLKSKANKLFNNANIQIKNTNYTHQDTVPSILDSCLLLNINNLPNQSPFNNSDFSNNLRINDTNDNNNSNLIQNDNSKKNNDKTSLNKILIENKEKLELIILYSYFISKWKSKLILLNIMFIDTYSKEIERYLRKALDIQLVNFHFMKFFNKLSDLAQLYVNINSLDSTSFEKIIYLIHNNSFILRLRLDLFSPDSCYTPANLYKMCKNQNQNIKNIIQKNNAISVNSAINNIDIDNALIECLLHNYEDNMKYLFNIIKDKTTLNLLEFNFDLPSLIYNNDDYIRIITKFIFNLLIMLSFSSQHKLRIFKLNAQMLPFDASRNDNVEALLDSIDFNDNDITLQEFTFRIKFTKVSNIGKLLSINYNTLILGNFDEYSFKSFIDSFCKEEFTSKTKLSVVTLILSNCVLCINSIKEHLIKYFNVNIPNIKKLSLHLHNPLTKEEQNNIHTILNEENSETRTIIIDKKKENLYDITCYSYK